VQLKALVDFEKDLVASKNCTGDLQQRQDDQAGTEGQGESQEQNFVGKHFIGSQVPGMGG
jgi:hypothetical protein